MRALLALFICFVLAGCDAQAQDPAAAFSLPKLDYAYDALNPAIDTQTMKTHHTKHHQAYVDKLNEEAEKAPELKTKSLEEIMANISAYSPAVRNNAGGHWNHSFFWKIMAPKKQTGNMSPELRRALESTFGSVDNFRMEFEKAGVGQFGSGWVWLIVDGSGKLQITTTPNQDNPLMNDAKTKGTPIIGNDLWEHAYYLKYQNKRGDYLKSWWQIVNWDQVSKNYAAAQK